MTYALSTYRPRLMGLDSSQLPGKNVLVVGMPRSGTSMTAGALARAGYSVSDDPDAELRPGDIHNPGGYWENEGLIELNAQVLGAAGFDFDNTWLYDAIDNEAAERITTLDALPGHREYVQSMPSEAPWLWKDPRLCYTLSYWWKLLDPATTCVVLTKRSPEAILNSFVRLGWRDGSPEGAADVLERVDNHLAAAHSSIEALRIPYLELDYEQCLADPAAAAAALSEFTGHPVTLEDMGVEASLDHSSVRGRAGMTVERAYDAMPIPARKVIKFLTPTWLIHALFPERREAPND